MTPFQQFIALSRYARWIDASARRETWDETVDRYMRQIEPYTTVIGGDVAATIRRYIYDLEVMPSMRFLMASGPALERDNTAGYNCSYLPVDSIEAFDEALYILMNGTGVGFSVERKYTDKLPSVPFSLRHTTDQCVATDSKEGWATALRQLIKFLYSGVIPVLGFDNIRPAGARLKTFGGRASGPEPLRKLFKFVIETFRKAEGRKLSPLECHDIMCKIGEVVVVGGVRRSALISLSDLSDPDMPTAKAGAWWEDNGQRALANNSAVYESTPTREEFDKEWAALVASGSGERGIFNREAARNVVRSLGRRNPDFEFGTNPCSEIILRPYQFC